jgi:hypothetical protein
MDNRNISNREEDNSQQSQQKDSQASKEEINRLKPQDHLNDGTNDLENGDQEPTSASGNKPSSETDRS